MEASFTKDALIDSKITEEANNIKVESAELLAPFVIKEDKMDNFFPGEKIKVEPDDTLNAALMENKNNCITSVVKMDHDGDNFKFDRPELVLILPLEKLAEHCKEIEKKDEVLDCPSVSSTYELVNVEAPQASCSQPIVFETASCASDPSPKRIRLDVRNFNLSQVLDETITGRALKAIYEKYQEFDSKYQGYLCDLIVQHFLNQPVFKRLSNQDLSEIADSIVQIFPKEAKTTYYIEPLRKKFSKDNKPGFARGKLTDKYRNRLTFLRKAGLVPCSREAASTCSSDTESLEHNIDEETKNDLVWLQHNSDPWNTVENKWKNTFEYRRKLVQNPATEVQEILKVFNILRHPLGCTLLDLDFKEIYKDSYGQLFTKFDSIFQLLVQLRRQYLNKNENLLLDIIENPGNNLSSTAREYIQLSLLGSLLPPKTFKRSSKAWIPSTDDCKEGVVVHVKIPGDIPTIIEDKKKKVAKYGLTLQPFIIIEGPTYNNIINIFVSFNDILYKVHSVMKGLDACFQIITLLNLKYPYESEHIWLFIQKSMYNIHTKYDNLPNILDVVNKIKNRLR